MRRSIMVAAAAIAVGLSACSTGTPSSPRSTSASPGSGAATPSSGASTAMVTVDGKNRNVPGIVACTTAAGRVNIAIGGASSGVGAVLTDAATPSVKSVGLGTVDGVTLGYTQGAPGGRDAHAVKDGSTYKISGTATGVDQANLGQPVSKPFTIRVTCP